jgi:hypothetical protein
MKRGAALSGDLVPCPSQVLSANEEAVMFVSVPDKPGEDTHDKRWLSFQGRPISRVLAHSTSEHFAAIVLAPVLAINIPVAEIENIRWRSVVR